MTKAMTHSVRKSVKTSCKSENHEKITKTRLIRSRSAHKAFTRINTKSHSSEDRVTYIHIYREGRCLSLSMGKEEQWGDKGAAAPTAAASPSAEATA